MIQRFPPRFRKPDSAGGTPTPGVGAEPEAQAAKSDRPLRCSACGHVITSESARRPVEGAHIHERTNPAGYHFRFGCFSNAPGCTCVGGTSGEHTWFAGCRWRIAVCGGCGEHLGWRFTGADEFHGLILNRLTAAAG